MLSTPVVFIIFNRPEHTKKTFAAIKKMQVSKLFIVADGPRKNNIEDERLCSLTRLIINEIDWPCDVMINFSETNMGAKKRVSTGLDWVFSYASEAIILEDDCLASTDFFIFCESLLAYYEKNNQIYMISGNNFIDANSCSDGSYYFSKYCHCWGWATWKRAWESYSENIEFWNSWKNSTNWKSLFINSREEKYWKNIFSSVTNNEVDAWDYPWMASIWFKKGLCAVPKVNLVSNIGFGIESTNTKNSASLLSDFEIKAMDHISHPSEIYRCLDGELADFDFAYGGQNLKLGLKIKNKINSLLNGM